MSEITGFKIRFQEAGGSQLRNKFNTDLGKGKHCGTKDCHPCDVDGDSRQNCRNRNIVYESTCLLCNPTECSDQKEEKVGSRSESTSQEEVIKVKQAKTGVYIGETSRSLYERSKEHITDAKNYSHKSHIIKHWMLSHQEENEIPQMSFKIKGMYKDCLSRQLGEAMRIFYSSDMLLNSKGEYLSNCVTRLTITETDWESKERLRKEEEEDTLEKDRVEKFKVQKTSQLSNPLEPGESLTTTTKRKKAASHLNNSASHPVHPSSQ